MSTVWTIIARARIQIYSVYCSQLVGVSDALVGMVKARLKVLLMAGGGVASGCGTRSQHGVTPK